MKLKTRKPNGHGNYIFYSPVIETTADQEIVIPSSLESINLTAVTGYPPVIFNHFVNVSNDIFNYKLIIEGNTVLNLNLDLNLIKQSNTLNADQVLIGITDKVIDTCLQYNGTVLPYNVSSYELVNMFNNTYVSKDGPDSAVNDGNKCPFKIFVPSKNSSNEDLVVVMYGNNAVKEPNLTHTYSSDTVTLEVSELVKFKQILSDITITASKPTIQVDDSVTFTVTTSDTSVTEVYAEPVYGIITKTRIPLNNGVGTVVLSSSGLSVGDPVRVKFGYKFWTSVVEYTNTVT